MADKKESPVLLVADVSGRLWRSRPKHTDPSSPARGGGIAFAEGWLNVGNNRDADTPTNFINGPSFDMIQLKAGRGRRRCLPLGVDQMSMCQASNDGGGTPPGQDILMVAAGSQSISPPSVVIVPNTNDVADEEVIVEDIRGLESTQSQIVSTLLVSSNAIGVASWRSLLRAMTESKDTVNAAGSDDANSAVLLGTSDGSIYCSLVSVHVAVQQVGEEGSNRNRRKVESLHVTPAKQIHRMAPTQGVASMFLIPNEGSTKDSDIPPNVLVVVGRLGSVSVLNFSSVSSSLQSNMPLFSSKSTALPRIGTCTSACPYQHCRMGQDAKKKRAEITIMAIFDDGSSYSCPLEIESVREVPVVPMLQNKSPATRLPIRRDAAIACSDLNVSMSGNETSSGIYVITFGGFLVGLRAEIQRQTGFQADQPQVESKAPDGIMTALKRLCGASNMDTAIAKQSKSVSEKDGGISAIQETRDAGRMVSRKNASKYLNTKSTDKWLQTCHLQQPMLSDLVASQPSKTKDLPPLYYADHKGVSTKVVYAGVVLNECTSLQRGKSPREVHQSANQWNSRPMISSSTLSCTFEHSTEEGAISIGMAGARIQDDEAPTQSKKKRKLQYLTGFPAGRAKSAYSDAKNEDDILGLVAANSNPDIALSAHRSALGDAMCEIFEAGEQNNPSTYQSCVVRSSFVEAEGAMIQSEMLGRYDDNGKAKEQATDQSILLSSCSTIAKKITEKRTLNLKDGNSASGGLESIFIDTVPSAASNDDGSKRVRYGTTSSRLEPDGSNHSNLPLLRSCIVGLLAKRVSAPGEASIPLGEMEAATLLDSYHKAIKNPRTKKMAMYLVMKADELLSKMKQRESCTCTEDCAGDESVDVESVYLLYNQLRAIPLPLG